MTRRPSHLLFVCVENSCRSQMAEGLARTLGGERVVACSAGSRPSGRVDPRAVRLMAERGVDLSHQLSKGLAELPAGLVWDCVVTMGCGDACAGLPARRREDWDLTDPKDLDAAGFRAVCDSIESRVRELIERIARPAGTAPEQEP